MTVSLNHLHGFSSPKIIRLNSWLGWISPWRDSHAWIYSVDIKIYTFFFSSIWIIHFYETYTINWPTTVPNYTHRPPFPNSLAQSILIASPFCLFWFSFYPFDLFNKKLNVFHTFNYIWDLFIFIHFYSLLSTKFEIIVKKNHNKIVWWISKLIRILSLFFVLLLIRRAIFALSSLFFSCYLRHV